MQVKTILSAFINVPTLTNLKRSQLTLASTLFFSYSIPTHAASYYT